MTAELDPNSRIRKIGNRNIIPVDKALEDIMGIKLLSRPLQLYPTSVTISFFAGKNNKGNTNGKEKKSSA